MSHHQIQPTPALIIAALKDALRRDIDNSAHNRVVMTAGVVAFISDRSLFRGFHRHKALLRAVRDHAAFGANVDPYGEHDFGSFGLFDERFFWKIDYYDRALSAGSPDPADAAVTCRVLTIMLAADY
ncbi:DUF3768 domain-containing protein [Sphingomonas sp. SRS2]|uniref:DUF3768 domain-containing protein n=1 Tax=Sphingomonas sp. SRS2 TaxID=133190 RepID=UPI0006184309|nr:DUF3768 domain-containing protein [Sphingomonas sp. SRS2]KKC24252.1 hypothetical protein WP12_20315 [Sphingomonas sp. SRS2]